MLQNQNTKKKYFKHGNDFSAFASSSKRLNKVAAVLFSHLYRQINLYIHSSVSRGGLLPRGFGQPPEKIADVHFNILYLRKLETYVLFYYLMTILPIEIQTYVTGELVNRKMVLLMPPSAINRTCH